MNDEAKNIAQTPSAEQPDWFLQSLISMVNSSDLEIYPH